MLMDAVTTPTAYQRMKQLCLNIGNEMFTDKDIHYQHILPGWSSDKTSLKEFCILFFLHEELPVLHFKSRLVPLVSQVASSEGLPILQCSTEISCLFVGVSFAKAKMSS